VALLTLNTHGSDQGMSNISRDRNSYESRSSTVRDNGSPGMIVLHGGKERPFHPHFDGHVFLLMWRESSDGCKPQGCAESRERTIALYRKEKNVLLPLTPAETLDPKLPMASTRAFLISSCAEVVELCARRQ
jgi:hypothetical protein